MNTNHLFITGGTGKTGRRVAARLWEQGIPVRIGSRSGQPPFDWQAPETWPQCLHQVERVYLNYSPDLAIPGAAETIRSFAMLAVDSGVRRIVLLSGRGEDGALASEQAIRECGAEWTIVRSSWFNQNFSESLFLEPVIAGEVSFPAGAVAEPFIDVDDIADVVAAALTDAKHAGQLYEVTGPRLLTFAEAVGEIAQACGRDIRYVPVTAEEYKAALVQYGLPAGEAAALAGLFATVLDGRNAHIADGVQCALGREPRDFAVYAREAAASGVWKTTAARR